MAFVKSQYSDEMGNFFLNLGVEAVVCVNTHHKTDDKKVEVFQKHFYKKIFEGMSVQGAFNEALNQSREHKSELKVCCCAHKHRSQCKWFKYALENGFKKAHRLHCQHCKCNLIMNKHKWNCQFFSSFK